MTNPECWPKLEPLALLYYWSMLNTCPTCDEREAHRINDAAFGPDSHLVVGHGVGCTCWGRKS